MKNKIKKLAGAVLIAAVPLLMTSCSPKSSTSTPPENAAAAPMAQETNVEAAPMAQDTTAGGAEIERGKVFVDAATETATVQSIDPATRTVVLLHSDGTTSSYECGSNVRNFDQIKVGDHVTASVGQSVALALIKGGVPPAAGTATAIVRSPMGAKPGGQVVDTVAFTAKIISVDASTRMVTLQTPNGQNQTIKAGPDIDLTGVNPGDDVGVKITRAFAISVTEPTNAP